MCREMDQWIDIHRRVLIEGVSKRQILRETGMHWQALEKIIRHVEPPGYRRSGPPARPRIGPYLGKITEILDADRKLAKKQRHTARRIWQRLVDEEAFDGGYTTVKDAVRRQRLSRACGVRPSPGEGAWLLRPCRDRLPAGGDRGARAVPRPPAGHIRAEALPAAARAQGGYVGPCPTAGGLAFADVLQPVAPSSGSGTRSRRHPRVHPSTATAGASPDQRSGAGGAAGPTQTCDHQPGNQQHGEPEASTSGWNTSRITPGSACPFPSATREATDRSPTTPGRVFYMIRALGRLVRLANGGPCRDVSAYPAGTHKATNAP